MRISDIFKSKERIRLEAEVKELSALKGRIEDKIKSLSVSCASVMYEKQGTSEIRDTTNYCRLVLKEADLNSDIALLESLLKK